MTQDSFTFNINSNDAVIQQCPSFYKIHIDISKNRFVNKQWKAQTENCLRSWSESVALVGFEEGRKVKDFGFLVHINLISAGHFTPVLDPVPCIICFAKSLMNILGFFCLQTWPIKPQLIHVIKMYMFYIKVLEGPHHT